MFRCGWGELGKGLGRWRVIWSGRQLWLGLGGCFEGGVWGDLWVVSSPGCVLAPRWDAVINDVGIPGPSRCVVPRLWSWGPLGREVGRVGRRGDFSSAA